MAKMYERFLPSIKVSTLHGDLSENSIILLTTIREDYGQDIAISVPFNFRPTSEVKTAFASTHAIDWEDSAYMFSALDRLVSPLILEISTILKGNATVCNPNYYFVMETDRALDLDVKTLIPGTELKPLDLEKGVDFLTKNWKYTKCRTDEFTGKMLEKNPSSGVYEGDKVASGIMCNSNGLMGMLYTEDAHRNKGYAQLCMRHLIQQLALSGFLPSSAVEQKNIPWVNFHKRIGMRLSHEVDFIFYSHVNVF